MNPIETLITALRCTNDELRPLLIYSEVIVANEILIEKLRLLTPPTTELRD